MSLAKKLAELISEGSQSKTSPYDTTGVVKRIEGKTAYVVFDGGHIETPVDLTIACEKGDIVVVRVSGTKARLTGNLTAPPTDDKKAREAEKTANKAYKAARSVVERADAGEFDGEDGQDGEDGASVYEVRTEYCLSTSNSQFIPYQGMEWSEDLPEYVPGCYYWTRTVIYYDDDDETVVYGDPVFSLSEQLSAETRTALDSTNNHFWHDNSGAYVTEQEGSYETGYATRITNAGILQSYNNKLMSSWTNSGVSFYKSDGETALASFGIGGISFASDIPFTIGNSTSFIKWVNEGGTWKIKICADSIEMGGQDVMVDGDAGQWYSGTGITGTSATATAFPNSGVATAKVGDMYLNTSTSNTYRCTLAGAPSAAKWVFVNNIKGADGQDGEDGEDGADGIDVTSQYMGFDSTNGLRVYSGNKGNNTYNKAFVQIKGDNIQLYRLNGTSSQLVATFGSSISLKDFTISTVWDSGADEYRAKLAGTYYTDIAASGILRLKCGEIHIGNIVTDGNKFYTMNSKKDDTAGNGNAVDFYNLTSGDGRGATIQYARSQSDRRLKDDITELVISSDRYIGFYSLLKPVCYKYKEGVKSDADGMRHKYGFIAQDVEEAAFRTGLEDFQMVYESESVEGTPIERMVGRTYKALDYESFHALHVLYAQDLNERLKAVEQKLSELTA